MTLKEYQKEVDKWASQFETPYWKPLAQLARLTEEVGELSREINHRYGDKPKKSTEENKEVADELADVIFTAICIANNLKIDLDEAFDKMMEKYKIRDKDRHQKKD
jgi:NTP pyrophosphatase (non-canonical NTP hydrolase)